MNNLPNARYNQIVTNNVITCHGTVTKIAVLLHSESGIPFPSDL